MTPDKRNHLTVIGTGSGLFCGSGKNKTRVLHALGQMGHDTHYVSLCEPHLARQQKHLSFSIHVANPARSDFLGQPGLLTAFAISEIMTEIAATCVRDEGRRPILWGTYLFPFVLSALMAKSNIQQELGVTLPLVASPAGSDIWQIGPKQPHSVRALLFDERVDHRITYTERFRNEIYQRYGRGPSISIIPPILNTDEFHPYRPVDRQKARDALGIGRNAVVAIHHSNMRPVKNPLLTVEIMKDASLRFSPSHPLWLLLVGPHPVLDGLEPVEWPFRQNEITEVTPGLRLLWTGLADNVVRYLMAADFAVNFSFHDSFNISLMEAMACGLPSISTDVAGIAEHIVKCGGGFVVPTTVTGCYTPDINAPALRTMSLLQNPAECVDTVVKLASDEKLRESMGVRSSEYIRERFCEERIAGIYARELSTL